MDKLKGMETFVRIVEAGSIGKAADQLGFAKSVISRRLSELEKQLGVQLINRTTRSFGLTDAGQVCFEHAARVLDTVAEMDMAIGGQAGALKGTLRIATPMSFGIHHLVPALDQFANLHPALKLHIDLSDRYIDLVESGIDMAIRIGELRDSSLRARVISKAHTVLVASPDYLAKHGTPARPQDLNRHTFLEYEHPYGRTFSIKDEQGRDHAAIRQSRITANNGDFLNELAKRGHGLVVSPKFMCLDDLATGKLVALLTDCTLPDRNIYAVYPETRFIPQPARHLIDFLADYFEASGEAF
jgi:DNA-binding transcriptional LysR family regulator